MINDSCIEHGVRRIDISRLDLRGYDYKTLLGALNTLPNVDEAFSDGWFTETYAGARLVHDALAAAPDSAHITASLVSCGWER